MLKDKPRLQQALIAAAAFVVLFVFSDMIGLFAWSGLFTGISFVITGVLLLMSAKAGEFGGPKT